MARLFRPAIEPQATAGTLTASRPRRASRSRRGICRGSTARDHRHRPRPPCADDVRQRQAATLSNRIGRGSVPGAPLARRRAGVRTRTPTIAHIVHSDHRRHLRGDAPSRGRHCRKPDSGDECRNIEADARRASQPRATVRATASQSRNELPTSEGVTRVLAWTQSASLRLPPPGGPGRRRRGRSARCGRSRCARSGQGDSVAPHHPRSGREQQPVVVDLGRHGGHDADEWWPRAPGDRPIAGWSLWRERRWRQRDHVVLVEPVNLAERDEVHVAVDAEQVLDRALGPADLGGDGALREPELVERRTP
jgi:hypothetical protein